MPAPQSSPARPRRFERHRKYFTVSEANQTLPLVSRIVRDIALTHAEVNHLQIQVEKSLGKVAVAFQQELDRTIRQLDVFVAELTALGIDLKDYETGLIQFPAHHGQRTVYLCWKLGDEAILYWHELHAGYAGRQSIRLLQDSE